MVVNDIPQHGIRAWHSDDPECHRLIAKMHQTAISLMKPNWANSVFVENEAELAVVAYRLIWEHSQEGASSRFDYSNAAALMGYADHEPQSCAGHAIPPGGSRWFASNGMHVAVKTNPSVVNYGRDSILIGSWGLPRVDTTEDLNRTLVSFSIDGAFFTDGSFVGRDSSDFFRTVQLFVRGKYELYKAVEASARRGRSLSEVFRVCESLARMDPFVASVGTPDAAYRVSQNTFAREINKVRSHRGDQVALARVYEALSRSWPELHKM